MEIATLTKADLWWRCHVCGEERPDERISVAKHTYINGMGLEMDENVRFCNDRPSCEKEAKLRGHTMRNLLKAEQDSLSNYRKARWWKLRFYSLLWGMFVAAIVGAAFALGMSIPI